MITMVVLVTSAWVVLTLAGWILLGPLERRRRDAMLPVAPLFGVVIFVIVLSNTTLVLSVRHGVWVLAALLFGVAVLAFRRDRTWWRPSRRAAGTLALTAACGALPALWALSPAFALGDSNVVQPNMNNDAFYYVTVAGWLQDHAATDPPIIGATPADEGLPPSYSTARQHLDLDLRIGQELTHAALTTIITSEVQRTWYPTTALWILLLPAAGAASARFFRLRLVTGLVLGTVTSVSALVLTQFASQNSDSLLGTALVWMALGAVVRDLDGDPPVPRILASLSLTALVGTYTEYVPLIAPALAVAVLVRPRREILRTVRTATVILLVAIAAAPFVWFKAVRSLLFLGGVSSRALARPASTRPPSRS